MFDGGYEAAELRTITANLESKDVVLEAGSGIGLISAYCASRIGGDRVYTYEANSEMEPLIRDVYLRNGVSPNIEFSALGLQEGMTSFFLHKNFWSSSTRTSANSRYITVPVRNINAEISRIQPNFLIMDIEGGEAELLREMDLSTIEKISIELHTRILGEETVEELRQILIDNGFHINENYSTITQGHSQELFLTKHHFDATEDKE